MNNNKTFKIDNKYFFENFLKIITKNNDLVDFKMNEPQLKLNSIVEKLQAENKPVRIIILKARQMGFSTYTEGLIFKTTVTGFNIKSGIITHSDTATNNLFNMSKNFYYNMPDPKPVLLASNSKELIFDTKDKQGLGSKIKCMTAGSSGVGRSDTYNVLHISEYAFWEGNKRNTLRGLLQSVPDNAKSIVIIESTANGYEEFKEMWDNAVAGKSDYVPVFFAWYEMKEYQMPYWGFTLTDKEKEIKQRYNLTLEQLAWRRWTIANKCDGDEEYFNQEYPDCPENAFISTGTSVFDKEKIIKRINDIKETKYTQGYFDYDYDGLTISNIRWINDNKGCIKLFIKPKEGHPYVLGGDTAGDGSDFFTGQMIDNSTGNQVATLKMLTDEDLYAQQMYCLGMYYNTALIGLEVNFSTFPIKELQRLEYPNLYIRIQEDTFTNRILKSYGFRTTTKTRPIILADLIRIVREDVTCFNDLDTLNEMLTIVRNQSNGGKIEAMNGYHDDLVMGMAITYYIRDQQDFTVDLVKHNKTNEVEEAFNNFFKISNNNDEESGFLEW